MREIAIWIACLAAVFVGGALLAPWVWWAVQDLASGSASEFLRALSGHPFHRYVHRCLLAVAILGFVPMLRLLHLPSLAGLGWPGFASAPRPWLRGWAWATVMFLAWSAPGWIRGGSESSLGVLLHPGAGRCLRAFGTAVLVGTFEEFLFRGLLCGGLRSRVGWPGAILFSSAIFAGVHYLNRPTLIGPVEWDSGFRIVWGMWYGGPGASRWVPGTSILFLAGIFLGVCLRHPGQLALSMGVHSGWIFWLKMAGTSSGLTFGTPPFGGWTACVLGGAILVLGGVCKCQVDGNRPARTE